MSAKKFDNPTTQIVRMAMKIVAPQVREPKVVRDGIVKKIKSPNK